MYAFLSLIAAFNFALVLNNYKIEIKHRVSYCDFLSILGSYEEKPKTREPTAIVLVRHMEERESEGDIESGRIKRKMESGIKGRKEGNRGGLEERQTERE